MFVSALVEGPIDEAVARRLVHESDLEFDTCYGKKGIGYLKQKIAGFNMAATGQTILAIADFMDAGFECPAAMVENWLPNRHANMIFRIAVREIESWLLADRTHVAEFLKVAQVHIPRNPENLNDPKQALVNLARRSKSRRIQDSLAPKPGSSAHVGPLYVAEITKYVRTTWDVVAARQASTSLDKCLARLEALTGR